MTKLGTNTNRNSWNQQTVYAGVNAWVGKLADGTITSVQTLPWDYSPWGCASGWRGSCNNGWIQWEICEDGLGDKNYFEATYKESVELAAYLCKMYGLNPKGTVSVGNGNIPVILCHKDSYNYGMGSNHADIYHWWNKYGKTMDDFRNDVAAIMNDTVTPTPTIKPNVTTPTTAPSGQIYRIRKSWADSKSQKGAYRNLEFAKTECDKYIGYSVFDEAGVAVYTAKAESVTPTTPVTPSKIIIPNITYAVKTKKHGILPDVKNRTDCAGYQNSEITAIKIGVDSGSVKYRVHTTAGKWMPYVTGADWKDYNNGYAGDDKTPIDAIEVIYTTDISKTGGKYYKACYQVKAKGYGSYWSNQYDNEKTNGQDGYAGSFGTPIVEVKMSLSN
jgi:hypothetical protein